MRGMIVVMTLGLDDLGWSMGSLGAVIVVGLLLVCWGAIGARGENGRRRRWWAVAVGLLCLPIIRLLSRVGYDVPLKYLVDDVLWTIKTADPQSLVSLSLMFLPSGAVFLWRGLRGDPSESRLRCPRCWRDMRAYLPGALDGSGLRDDSEVPAAGAMVCPECRYEAKDRCDLYGVRRRWGMVALGLLLLLQYAWVCLHVR